MKAGNLYQPVLVFTLLRVAKEKRDGMSKDGTKLTYTYNQLQALARTAKYQEDYKILHITKLIDKYNLDIPIDIDLLKKCTPEMLEIFTPELHHTVRVIPANKIKSCMVKNRTESGEYIDIIEFDFSPNLKEKKYLTLEINICEKQEKIIDEIKKKIKFYKISIKKEKQTNRDKPPTINPWDVYDLHFNNGLDFTKIARKLSGLKGNPSYNKELEAYLKRVRRSYDIAKQEMEQIERKIENFMDE